MLVRFAYRKRRKAEEMLLRAYLRCTTRPSWAQTAWLLATYLANGHLYDLPTSRAHARVLGTMAAQYASADRPPPQAAPGGPPGLSSRRIDGPRRPRKRHGCLSHQRRRRATRYPFTGRVERISENFPPPVLEHVLESFPIAVQGFHSDNGSG